MGKWTFLRNLNLTRLTPKAITEFANQTDLAQYRTEWLGKPDRDVAAELVGMRADKEEMETALKTANARIETLNQLLVDRWLADDVAQEKVVFDVGTLSIVDEPYPEIKDQAAAFDWLRAHHLGDLIKPTVQWKALQAAIKELAMTGEALPDPSKDGIDVFIKQTIRVTKTK